MQPRSIYLLLNLILVGMVASSIVMPDHLLPIALAGFAIVSERLRKQLCISIIRYALPASE